MLNRELPQRNIELAVTPLAALGMHKDMEVHPLFDERFVVMAGARNKWVGRRKVPLRHLINEPWVLPPPDTLPGMTIAEVFRAEGLPPPEAQIVSFSVPVHEHLLATGRFITMLPMSMLRFGNHLRLRPIGVAMFEKTYSTGIITLKNRTLGPVAQLFIECALKTAAPLR